MKNSRRKFIKRGIAALAVLPATGAICSLEALAEEEALGVVDTESQQAKALGYVHDATKVDTKKYPKRAGEEGKKQFCKNCILLQTKGLEAKDQKGKWGKCGLFQNALVSENGWCQSWTLNPNA